MDMDTCTDSRGIRRGRCTDPTCPCPSYEGGAERKRCIKCAHPPGKHQHLDNPSANMGTSSGIMPNSSHTGYHIAPPQLPPDLQQCAADGCTNKVWYEFDLQEAFDYCSPGCRDRHLLPIKNHKLKEELVAMKLELESEARKDSPKMIQRQQSNGRSQASRQQLPSQGHSSPPKSSPISSPSTSAKAGSKPGKTKEVMIEKKARRPSGLILSKKPYVNDKAEVVGFVIVGVVKDAPVYSKFQDDQIRLLDVIETVNDTPCHKLFLPNMDLQERFEHSIEERDRIKLVLNRCIALPPVSSALSYAKKKSTKNTHIRVLMWDAENKDDMYGLSLNHEHKVKGTVTDSPGDLSRVKFDDKITMYMVISQDDHDVREGQLVSDKQLSSTRVDLQAAHRNKNHVILFIKKSEESSYI